MSDDAPKNIKAIFADDKRKRALDHVAETIRILRAASGEQVAKPPQTPAEAQTALDRLAANPEPLPAMSKSLRDNLVERGLIYPELQLREPEGLI